MKDKPVKEADFAAWEEGRIFQARPSKQAVSQKSSETDRTEKQSALSQEKTPWTKVSIWMTDQGKIMAQSKQIPSRVREPVQVNWCKKREKRRKVTGKLDRGSEEEISQPGDVSG